MNGLPYYKAYPRDFIEGTIGMSFELKAAYRLVLDLIYMQGGKLPDDPRYISGLLGCSIRAWKKYRQDLIDLGKLYAENEIISNFRADKELETLAKLQDKQRENASTPRKNKGLEKPRPNHTEPEPEPDIRDTNVSLSGRNKPERFEEFWNVYPHRGGAKKHRKEAVAKYAKAVKAGVSEQSIITAATNYASDAQVLRGYGRNPDVWLNNEGWNDEIERNRNPVETSHTGRSSPHDNLMAGFGSFANSDRGRRDDDFECRGGSYDPGNEAMDCGAGGYASQPLLRLIGSN